MSARRVDLAVIGAGIAGAATAYYAAKAGMSVALFDRDDAPGGAAASAATAAGVRAQGRAPFELPLARLALDAWAGLADELGADLGYERNGMAICIDDDAQWDALRRRVAMERAAGFDVRLLDAAALRALVPAIAPGMRGASYSAIDGQANPSRTLRAIADAAGRAGALIARGETVHAIDRGGAADRNGADWTVRSDRHVVRAGAVLLAAGAWTPVIAGTIGARLPIRMAALQMMATEPTDVRVKPVLAWVGKAISLKQLPSGRYWIGGGWIADGDASGRTATRLESITGSARVARDLIPALGAARITRTWAGLEAYTPDEQPLIGPLGSHPGVWVAAGFSGHGFAIGPGVGAALAPWIASGRPSDELRPFSPARFATEANGGNE